MGVLRVIESALLLNGVAIVPLDAHTAKVVVATAAKNPRSEGVRLYANAADLPQGDEVVSYYMPLAFISPEEAKSIFDQQAPIHSYGSYVPAPSAQAIILTEDTSVLRQLIALKELIDVPPAQMKTEFIQLQRADAEKVAHHPHQFGGKPQWWVRRSSRSQYSRHPIHRRRSDHRQRPDHSRSTFQSTSHRQPSDQHAAAARPGAGARSAR